MKKFGLYISLILLIASLTGTVFVLFLSLQQKQDYEAKIGELRLQVTSQKADKDRIRDLWEKQASENDKLVLAQDALEIQNSAYQNEIKKSIRFINGKPEFFSTIDQDKLKTLETEIAQKTKKLEETTAANNEAKQNSKDTIDAMYIKAGEDQKNRANPDGIR